MPSLVMQNRQKLKILWTLLFLPSILEKIIVLFPIM